MRKQRVDVLLHILTDKIEPDFHRAELRVTLNFETPTFSKVELAARKKAYLIPSADAEGMVEYNEECEDGRVSTIRSVLRHAPNEASPHSSLQTPDLLVQSFTGPEGWYLVRIKDFGRTAADGKEAAIFECECDDFTLNESICKHMFLASRISSYPIRRFDAITIRPATTTSESLERANATGNVSVAILAEKQATRQRILDEMTTINNLTSQLRTLSLDPAPSRDQLTALEAHVTRTRRELSDLVTRRPLHAIQPS